MTRVTQSMLSSNMLRNLNMSYGKMGKLQEQLNSGSKIARASDDPVVAVKGMQFRTEIGKIEQFKRNTNEANAWLDTTDTALDQMGSALHRVQELITQATNDTNTSDDRNKIAVELQQIQQQIRDLGNTQISGKYIFSGTNSHEPLFSDNPTDPLAAAAALPGINGERKLELAEGVQLSINTPGFGLFKGVDEMMTKVVNGLNDLATPADDISGYLTAVQNNTNEVLMTRSQVGAKQNRLELIENRLSMQEITVTKQMSENEDTDYSKAITDLATTESIHQAALSVGAKIIQQTLVDFIR